MLANYGGDKHKALYDELIVITASTQLTKDKLMSIANKTELNDKDRDTVSTYPEFFSVLSDYNPSLISTEVEDRSAMALYNAGLEPGRGAEAFYFNANPREEGLIEARSLIKGVTNLFTTPAKRVGNIINGVDLTDAKDINKAASDVAKTLQPKNAVQFGSKYIGVEYSYVAANDSSYWERYISPKLNNAEDSTFNKSTKPGDEAWPAAEAHLYKSAGRSIEEAKNIVRGNIAKDLELRVLGLEGSKIKVAEIRGLRRDLSEAMAKKTATTYTKLRQRLASLNIRGDMPGRWENEMQFYKELSKVLAKLDTMNTAKFIKANDGDRPELAFDVKLANNLLDKLPSSEKMPAAQQDEGFAENAGGLPFAKLDVYKASSLDVLNLFTSVEEANAQYWVDAYHDATLLEAAPGTKLTRRKLINTDGTTPLSESGLSLTYDGQQVDHYQLAKEYMSGVRRVKRDGNEKAARSVALIHVFRGDRNRINSFMADHFTDPHSADVEIMKMLVEMVAIESKENISNGLASDGETAQALLSGQEVDAVVNVDDKRVGIQFGDAVKAIKIPTPLGDTLGGTTAKGSAKKAYTDANDSKAKALKKFRAATLRLNKAEGLKEIKEHQKAKYKALSELFYAELDLSRTEQAYINEGLLRDIATLRSFLGDTMPDSTRAAVEAQIKKNEKKLKNTKATKVRGSINSQVDSSDIAVTEGNFVEKLVKMLREGRNTSALNLAMSGLSTTSDLEPIKKLVQEKMDDWVRLLPEAEIEYNEIPSYNPVAKLKAKQDAIAEAHKISDTIEAGKAILDLNIERLRKKNTEEEKLELSKLFEENSNGLLSSGPTDAVENHLKFLESKKVGDIDPPSKVEVVAPALSSGTTSFSSAETTTTEEMEHRFDSFKRALALPGVVQTVSTYGLTAPTLGEGGLAEVLSGSQKGRDLIASALPADLPVIIVNKQNYRKQMNELQMAEEYANVDMYEGIIRDEENVPVALVLTHEPKVGTNSIPSDVYIEIVKNSLGNPKTKELVQKTREAAAEKLSELTLFKPSVSNDKNAAYLAFALSSDETFTTEMLMNPGFVSLLSEIGVGLSSVGYNTNVKDVGGVAAIQTLFNNGKREHSVTMSEATLDSSEDSFRDNEAEILDAILERGGDVDLDAPATLNEEDLDSLREAMLSSDDEAVVEIVKKRELTADEARAMFATALSDEVEQTSKLRAESQDSVLFAMSSILNSMMESAPSTDSTFSDLEKINSKKKEDTSADFIAEHGLSESTPVLSVTDFYHKGGDNVYANDHDSSKSVRSDYRLMQALSRDVIFKEYTIAANLNVGFTYEQAYDKTRQSFNRWNKKMYGHQIGQRDYEFAYDKLKEMGFVQDVTEFAVPYGTYELLINNRIGQLNSENKQAIFRLSEVQEEMTELNRAVLEHRKVSEAIAKAGPTESRDLIDRAKAKLVDLEQIINASNARQLLNERDVLKELSGPKHTDELNRLRWAKNKLRDSFNLSKDSDKALTIDEAKAILLSEGVDLPNDAIEKQAKEEIARTVLTTLKDNRIGRVGGSVLNTRALLGRKNALVQGKDSKEWFLTSDVINSYKLRHYERKYKTPLKLKDVPILKSPTGVEAIINEASRKDREKVVVGPPLTRSHFDHLGIEFSEANIRNQAVVRGALADNSQDYTKSKLNEGTVSKEIDSMIAHMLHLAYESDLSDEGKAIAKKSLSSFMLGDTNNGQLYANHSLNYMFYGDYARTVKGGSTGRWDFRKNAKSKFGSRGSVEYSMFADSKSHLSFHAFMEVINKGWAPGAGRNGFESTFQDKKEDLARLGETIKTPSEAREATAMAIIPQYSSSRDEQGRVKSAREQLLDTKKYLEEARKATEEELSFKKVRNEGKQILRDNLLHLKKASETVDFILSQEDFRGTTDRDLHSDFDKINTIVNSRLSAGQVQFLDRSRQVFRDIQPDVALSTSMDGYELGNLHNYLPMVSFKPDTPEFMAESTSMLPSTTSHVLSRNIGKDATFTPNLNGPMAFLSAYRALLYNTKTRAGYKVMSRAVGIPDPLEPDAETVSQFSDMAAFEIDPNEKRMLQEAIKYSALAIKQQQERDKTMVNHDKALNKLLFSTSGLAIKRVLNSPQQLWRQTIPVISDIGVTRPKLIPGMVSNIAASVGLNREFTKGMNEVLKVNAPFILSRAGDGIDLYDTKIDSLVKRSEKWWLKPSFVNLPLRGVAKVIDFAGAITNLQMKAFLEKPESVMMKSFIAASYKYDTGRELHKEDPEDIDGNAFHKAILAAEQRFAQSDRTRKGAVLQRHESFLGNFLTTSLASLSSHQFNITGEAQAGIMRIRDGKTKKDKIDGALKATSALVQTGVYHALRYKVMMLWISAAGGALGLWDEDEANQTISEATEHWAAKYFVGPYNKPVSKEKLIQNLVHYTGVPMAVDSLGVIPAVGPLFAASATSNMIKGGASDLISTWLGVKEPGEGLIPRKLQSTVSLAGVATEPFLTAIESARIYKESEGAEFDLNDLMYIVAQMAGTRELRQNFMRSVAEEGNVPMFEGQTRRTGGVFGN